MKKIARHKWHENEVLTDFYMSDEAKDKGIYNNKWR